MIEHLNQPTKCDQTRRECSVDLAAPKAAAKHELLFTELALVKMNQARA